MSNLRYSYHVENSDSAAYMAGISLSEPLWKKSALTNVGVINQGFVQPIKPTIQNIVAIESVLMNASYPYRYTSVKSLGDYAGNIQRFLISLDAYCESKNRVMDPHWILRRAHDPNFAAELKKIKSEAIYKTFAGTLLEYPEGFNKNSPYQFSDIGDVFNYAYLPHFIEKNDDHLKGFLPLVQSERWLKKYRKMARYILKDLKMPDIKRIDVLKDRASSSFFEGTTLPNWEVPQYISQSFSTKRQVAKRTIIQVSPENSRDALILQADDLNTVSLIELTIAELLELNFSRFIPGKNNNAFIEKFNKKVRKYDLYYMRDIEKEGITRPRNLITILLEELNDLYPEVDAFQFKDFFSENTYIYENELFSPTRGTGLGFCNSLVTLMQIIVWSLIDRNVISLNPEGDSVKNDFLVLNDDIIGFFENEEELEFFKDSEIEVFLGLGLIRKETKSFHSFLGGVFCEVYFRHKSFSISAKESYLRRSALLAFSAQNVTHAKSMLDRSNIYTLDYLREIQSFWGYEFSKNEFSWPASFGGWLSEKYKSISLFEFIKDDMIIDDGLGAAFAAAQVYVRKSRSKDKRISHRYLYLNSELRAYIKSEVDQFLPIDIPIDQLEDLYTRIRLSKDLFTRYWNLMMVIRQKVYQKNFTSNYAFAFEKYYQITEEDILPNYEGEIFYETYEGQTINDPFITPCKLRSIEKYMNRDYTENVLCSKFCATGIIDGSYYTPSKEHSMITQNYLSIFRVQEGINGSFLLQPDDFKKILRPQNYIEVSIELDLNIPALPLNGERKVLEIRNLELPGYDDFIFKAYLFDWINSNELLFYIQGDEFLKKAIRKDLKSTQHKKALDKLKRKRKGSRSESSSSSDRGDDGETILREFRSDEQIINLINSIQNIHQSPTVEEEPIVEDFIEPPIEEEIEEENDYQRIYRLNNPDNLRKRGTYLFTDGFELDKDAETYYKGAVFPVEMPNQLVELTPAFLYDLDTAQIKEDDVYPFDRNFRIYLAGTALKRIGSIGGSSDLSHLKVANDWAGLALGFTENDITEIESYFSLNPNEEDDPPMVFDDW